MRLVAARSCAANTWPDPGVALKPPVPQPQLTYRPGTGVRPMIGERSGVTSTMPPQLRSMRRRRKVGNSSQIASSVCVAMCSAAALAVGYIGVGAGADDQFALVGLRHIGVDRVRHHHAGHHRLYRFGHQCLQRDSSRAAGARPAIAITTLVWPAATTPIFLRRDGAARCLHAGDRAVGVATDRGHLAVLDDVDAERVGRARIAPGDRIVPRDAAAPLQRRAEHRIAHVGRDVQGRAEVLGLFRRQPFVVDAGQRGWRGRGA